MLQSLKRHPDSLSAAAAIDVDILRTPAGLALRYAVTGDMARLLIPELAQPTRADELWKHTCLEVFLRTGQGEGYFEFNFSPTGQWAAYHFAGYRQTRSNINTVDPGIGSRAINDRFELRAFADISRIPELSGPLIIGLSAIIEQTDGSKSYWALQHPVGKADFHHADCFALRLPPAESP